MKRTRLKNYLRDRRGAAAIELALGTVVMVAASLLALDLYLLAGMQTTTMHVAVSLADTVSREEPLGLTQTRNYGSQMRRLCREPVRTAARGAVPDIKRQLCGRCGV